MARNEAIKGRGKMVQTKKRNRFKIYQEVTCLCGGIKLVQKT